mgnify:CR=1 FL=1
MNTQINTPIERLIALYGNVSRAAIVLQVDRQLVDMWKKQGFIQFRRGKEIEKKTGGRIKAIEVWEAAAKGNLSA